MKFGFLLKANDNDITEIIERRFIELSITDNRGEEGDRLEIVLDDICGEVALPTRGKVLSIWIGDNKNELVKQGTFVVDEINHSGPPDRIMIQAKAQDLLSGFKSAKTRSFHKMKLGNILGEIATENKLKPLVEKSIAYTVVDHIDQTQESDMHFVARLAQRYGCRSKFSDGNLVFVKAGAAKSVSGKHLPVIQITRAGTESHFFTKQGRGEFTGVEAVWHNHRMSKKKLARLGAKGMIIENEEATAGSADRVRRIKGTFPDEATAKAAAEAEWKRLQRDKEGLQINFSVGNPRLKSDFQASVTGFRQYIDGSWVIVNCTHRITASSGFSSSVTLERPDDYFAENDGVYLEQQDY